MRYAFIPVTLGAVFIGSLINAASAQLNAYVGYLNNATGQPNAAVTPTPFDPDSTTLLISSGGVTARHDTGVIRLRTPVMPQ